jgi:hypothetical protein
MEGPVRKGLASPDGEPDDVGNKNFSVRHRDGDGVSGTNRGVGLGRGGHHKPFFKAWGVGVDN